MSYIFQYNFLDIRQFVDFSEMKREDASFPSAENTRDKNTNQIQADQSEAFCGVILESTGEKLPETEKPGSQTKFYLTADEQNYRYQTFIQTKFDKERSVELIKILLNPMSLGLGYKFSYREFNNIFNQRQIDFRNYQSDCRMENRNNGSDETKKIRQVSDLRRRRELEDKLSSLNSGKLKVKNIKTSLAELKTE